MQIISVPILLTRQAFTDEPYRNMFSKNVGMDSFSTMAATPIISIPVPKKKLEAMEIPKYLLKIMLRKVYRLAQPRLITILPRMAIIREDTLTSVE